MRVSLIVAAAENDVIGRKNALPWNLPDDLRYFRDMTEGKTVIMGRRTFESIGKPLPHRRNIVISTTRSSIDGCEVFPSLGAALARLRDEAHAGEVFVIGGAQLFQEALMEIMADFSVQKIYLTRVHATIEGDVTLPPIQWKHWKLLTSLEHPKDERHAHAFTFEVYERS